MKRGLLATIVTLSLLISVAYVQAAEPSGATVLSSTDRGELPAASPGNINVEAGNISIISIDTNASTYRWAGVLGNVSGNIVLGDASSNQMFTWTGEGRLIYASTAGSIAWASLADAVVGDMPAYLTSGASDNYTQTFTGASENIGSGIFSTISSDYAMTNNNVATPTWKTYSLKDGGSNLVWAGLVSAAGTSYAGDTTDFQMIIPEDGTAGNLATTSYNLWVELV